MAESKKTNKNALDVGAMYQIGAAGAGAAKAGNEGLKMLQRIGEFAIGFKLKSIENFKQAQDQTNKTFATFEEAVIQHDLDLSENTLTEVSKIKDKITDANKVMTSMKYNLRPGSDEYKAANKTKTNALLNLKKLEKANLKLSETFASTLKISNGEEFVQGPNGSRYQVKLEGTSKEKYYSSLIANKELGNALEWDSKTGEYMVNMQMVSGGAGNDTGIEDDLSTKSRDESKQGKVPLSSFSFAKPSTYTEDPSEKYMASMIQHGQRGENSLSKGGRKRILSSLEDDLIAMNPRDFAQLLSTGTVFVGEESVSYIDNIVNNEIGSIIDWEASQKDGDGAISDQEKVDYMKAIEGAKETIKDAIINGDEAIITKYKKEVENLVVKSAEEAFEEEAVLYEKNKRKNKVLTSREIEASDRRKLGRKIDKHTDLTLSPGSSGRVKGLKRKLEWKNEYISGSETIEEGWHVMYQKKDGIWYYEDFTKGDKVIKPIYTNNESAKDFYGIEY